MQKPTSTSARSAVSDLDLILGSFNISLNVVYPAPAAGLHVVTTARFVPFQPVTASLLGQRAASCSVKPSASPGATAHAFAFPGLMSLWRRRAHVIFVYTDGVTGGKLELFVELVLSVNADVMALAFACMAALPPHFRRRIRELPPPAASSLLRII
ncbi:hypothetical protein E2562_002129 [Oryza meyeriana var. granulata]|uniref:Uncharacterized protein n=1 Tax=Oryza meyeriana var. granulata TaxID=110450 RepID=A0A6G1EDK4_9ORYZ|nr:hypothetical protein E2562_002129 [Oryza meyeriana var. granulata]